MMSAVSGGSGGGGGDGDGDDVTSAWSRSTGTNDSGRGWMAATVATGAEATTVAEMTLVSDAAATLAATQSAANGGPDGDDILRQSPCSKKGKPYKIETKDIGIDGLTFAT